MSIPVKLSPGTAKTEFLQVLESMTTKHPTEGKLVSDFFNDPLIAPRWFSSPGSTALRFHHAYDGGLLLHVMEVYHTALTVAEHLGQRTAVLGVDGFAFTQNSKAFLSSLDLALAIFLHDLNKLGDAFGNSYYVPNMIKGGSVRSDREPFKTADKLYHYRTNPMEETKEAKAAHRAALYITSQCWGDLAEGDLSLAMVNAISPQLFGILSQDVQFAIRHHDGAYGRARRWLTGNETPLQMILHFADMWSSRIAKEAYQ